MHRVVRPLIGKAGVVPPAKTLKCLEGLACIIAFDTNNDVLRRLWIEVRQGLSDVKVIMRSERISKEDTGSLISVRLTDKLTSPTKFLFVLGGF